MFILHDLNHFMHAVNKQFNLDSLNAIFVQKQNNFEKTSLLSQKTFIQQVEEFKIKT